jgi:hypothetical protein
MADTAKAASKSSRLLTPRFRVSFPSVYEKQSYNNGTPRYSLTALFYPKTFTDKEKAKWKAILAALDKVSIEAFKKPMKELDRGVFKLPFHKGDEKEYQGYGDPEMRFCTLANSKRRPEILTLSNEPVAEEDFYAGCWARASVNPYAFNNIGKGLALGLGNIQKLKDDERFDGFTSGEDDFGEDDISDEFGGDDFGGDSSSDDDDFGA